MRPPKRAGLTSWARRSRTSRLRLPRWRHEETEQIPTPWKWVVRLIRMLCVLSGTALAGATFWYGYDGYLDNKCMTMMQEWSNLVDLLDYCDKEGSDSALRGITCQKINRHALPEPPSCVSRGTTQTVTPRPTFSPDFTSELGVPRNASRAVSTVQDTQRSSKLTTSGWDSSAPIEATATPTASQQSTSGNHITTTTLIQSRTVTHPELSDMPITPTPTVTISDLIPPPPASAYPTPTSHGESCTQHSATMSHGNSKTETVNEGSSQNPLHAQAPVSLGSSTLIRVAFSRVLDFQALVEQPTAMMQLFELLPLLLSLDGRIPASDIRVHGILPLRSTDGSDSITAVAHVYCPADQVVNLHHAFWDPVSQLYSLHRAQFVAVADMFKELFSLFNLAGSPESGTKAALEGTSPAHATHTSEGEHAITAARHFESVDFGNGLLVGIVADRDAVTDFMMRRPVAFFQAGGWTITFVCAPLIAMAYGFAMVFVARRYKRRRVLAVVELKS